MGLRERLDSFGSGMRVRVLNRVSREFARRLRRDFHSGLKVTGGFDLERIGSVYGGWSVPAAALTRGSVCYCAGVGEDISFDLGLIERFGCEVYAFDPTPRAIQFIAAHYGDVVNFHFTACGLWDEETVLKFYAPADPAHVSHSVLNLQKTDRYFEAPCRRLSALMRENRHRRLDLLKLDIEGAEYRVLESVVTDGLDIGVICVEYDEIRSPLDGRYRDRVRGSLEALLAYGYELVTVEVSNYTFVRKWVGGAGGERQGGA